MSENKFEILINAINKMHQRLKINGCLRDTTGSDTKDLRAIIKFINTQYEIKEDKEIIEELYNDGVSLEVLFEGINKVIYDEEDEITKVSSILNILHCIHKISTTYAIENKISIRKQN